MSKSSTQSALLQSFPRRIGLVPYWVTQHEGVVYVDSQHVVRCCECKEEVKNKGWLTRHLRECFGIDI